MPFRPNPRQRGARRSFGFVVAALAVVGPVAAVAEVPNRVEGLGQRDLRVASVAYQLATSNVDLCGEALEPQLGFVAGSGHERDGPLEVMAVVPGSPAALAGLPADAELMSVNGRALSAEAGMLPGRPAAERAEREIADELKKGPVTLRVSGDEGERTVRFAAVLGCSSRVELQSAPAANAWADGAQVVITTAMLDQCLTDDELALVIAHEMGHNILRHRARLASIGISVASRAFLSEAGLAKIREAEDEADRFAANMTRAAGYDLLHAAAFLERLISANGLSAGAVATHSTAARRLASWSVANQDPQPSPAGSSPALAAGGNTASNAVASGNM